MVFTREDAARAAQNIGIDFKKEAFQLEDLLNGMNTELARHGTKAGTADVTHDDPTMTAKLAVANLRVSPSYYSQRVGKSAWERSLARGVKHKGAKTEYKTVEFELEGFDDKEGTFSGYGAVFSNIDSGGDIIEPGAFTKTIAEGIGRVKILSGHNDSLLPIGIPTELREDAKGLFMSAKISDTTLGRDVKTLIHDGVLCELSIGYDPVVFDYDENGIRHLREVKLWEISVVTWAMNEQAVITDHKSDDAATRIEAEAQAIVTEVKAGRKISASRMKSLKDACTSMKAATKLLDKIISEAQGDNGKGHPPVSAHKSVERKSAPKKTVEFAELPSLSESILGNVYNVTDAFTTTANFVEGAGNKYPKGTNVVVVKVGDAYKYDVLAGFVDLSGYVEKEAGKGLSDENFTAALKDKLDGIAAGANKYVHPTHTAAASGLYKTTVDEEGHVTATTPVTKDDITNLGIPAKDTTYGKATAAADGLMAAADKSKLDGMSIATDSEVSEMLAEVYGE